VTGYVAADAHDVSDPAITSLHDHAARRSGVVCKSFAYSTDLLALHRARPTRYPHLLESVAHGTPHARYDILFACPGETVSLEAAALSGLGDFCGAIDRQWRAAQMPPYDMVGLPFRGGWFLYLGYEMAGQIEPRLRLPATGGTLPTAFITRIPAAVIRDHHRRECWLVAEQDAEALLDEMASDAASAQDGGDGAAPTVLALEEDPPAAFLDAVQQIRRYILDGDVFQVNLSRAWRAELSAGSRAADLYAALRRRNPAPFAGLATWGECAIVSSSPERLVRLRGDHVETRPIAGTRPRSAEQARDRDYLRELLAHPKERAEHVMLIDLERNDLGRICLPGSVQVDELMGLESYAHVHHIVSNVRGIKRPEVTPGEVIRAVFPGGTITGCPKVRCMEIIAELERAPRGPYTGAMGYLNRDGSLDLNILIRTLQVEGARVNFRAGAGIVADSEPAAELAETAAKARGLLLALGAGG